MPGEQDGKDNLDEELAVGELIALQLVEHVRRMRATEMDLPVLDETGVWQVTVKWTAFRSDSKPN